MAINASDVQRAYTDNFDLAGIIANADAQRAKEEQLNYQRQAQRDQQLYSEQKYIEDKYNIGTGTPLDRVTNETVSKAQAALYEAMRKNPRMSTYQAMSVTSPFLSGLPAKQQAAKLIKADVEKRRTTFDKDLPYLDWNKFEPDAYRKIFYDENGEVKKEIDPEGFSKFYSQAMSSPETMANYVNKDQLPTYLNKTLNERFPINEQRIPIAGTPGVNAIYDVAAVRPYEEYDPKERQSKIAATPVLVDDKIINVLPDNYYNNIFSQPAFKIAQAAKKEELKNDPYYKKLGPELQNQKAAYDVLQDIGLSNGKIAPKLDKTEWDMARQSKQDDISNYYREQGLNISRANLGLSQQRLSLQKQRVAQAYKDTPLGAIVDVLKGDPAAVNSVHTERHVTPLGAITAQDLTSLTPTGFVKSIDGGNSYEKWYYEPRKAQMGVIKYRKATPRDKGYRVGTLIPIENGQIQIVPQADISKYIAPFSSQLKVSPQKYANEYYPELDNQEGE